MIYSYSETQIFNTIDSILQKYNIRFERNEFFGWSNAGYRYTLLDTNIKILLYESKNNYGFEVNIKKFKKLNNKQLIDEIEVAVDGLRDEAIVDRVKKKERKDGLTLNIIGVIFMLVYMYIDVLR